MSSYSRRPTEADVESQAEDWCAQPPPKSQVRVVISISGSSAPHVKILISSCKKDFQTSSRTSHPTTRRPRDAGPRASFADFETLAWPFNQWSGISILEVYIGLHMGANGQPLYPQDPYLSGSQKWVDWG